jgi:predicted Zn finger-like uncharacterized protein
MISFACPSCGASGSVDDSLAGRQVRCKHCKHRSVIPRPGEPVEDTYALDEPAEPAPVVSALRESTGSAFVPSRGAEQTAPGRRRIRTSSPTPKRRASREVADGVVWGKWFLSLGVIGAIALVATALFARNGTVISGSVLVILGTLMVLMGYAAGAYGAFREDSLYGLLYLLIPLYAAYYIVTRWDDLWAWFACSTAGVVLVLIGTEVVRWAGVSV